MKYIKKFENNYYEETSKHDPLFYSPEYEYSIVPRLEFDKDEISKIYEIYLSIKNRKGMDIMDILGGPRIIIKSGIHSGESISTQIDKYKDEWYTTYDTKSKKTYKCYQFIGLLQRLKSFYEIS